MVFNNSSTSVTNHFYSTLRTHIYIERNVPTQPVFYAHTYTLCYEHIDNQHTNTPMQSCTLHTENKVFLSLPSVSVSFEFKLFRHVEWLGVFRGYSYWCIRDTSVSETWVCVCLFMCVSASVKTKRQSSEYFIPVRCLSPFAASQFWPSKRAGMHSESDKHKQTQRTHTHTPVQSAGVVVGSEGLVCRGFEPARPPCKHTCRQDPKPCCTPASPPLSLGTNPAHKQALR